MMYWYLLLWTLVFGLALHLITEKCLNWDWGRRPKSIENTIPFRIWRVLIAGLIAVGVVFLVSPIFYEYPLGDNVPVTWEGEKMIRHPRGCFELPWRTTASLGNDSVVSGNVTTAYMTDNPKVRKLHYGVELVITDPVKYFSVKDRRSSWRTNRDLDEKLTYQFYEINEKHARELVKFYNPEDRSQQESFKTLVKGFLDPVFAEDGLVVESASFQLRE